MVTLKLLKFENNCHFLMAGINKFENFSYFIQQHSIISHVKFYLIWSNFTGWPAIFKTKIPEHFKNIT